MERVNNIINDSVFKTELQKIEKYEENRIYCRHGMVHLTDVARIAYIHALEGSYCIDKEIIYAAALLHDIGRGRQYETGEDHASAAVSIAGDILARSGFSENERKLILAAAAGHRGFMDENSEDAAEGKTAAESIACSGNPGLEEKQFAALIKAADNESRQCFMCGASDTCKWSEGRKNHRLTV